MYLCICIYLGRAQLYVSENACVLSLTVGASIDFYAQTDATFLAPLQRDEPQETDHDALLQLMAHDALRVGVPGEGL